jgi:hypothetical protein
MPLQIFLLDGAQGLIIFPIVFLFDVIFTVLIEAFILYLYRYADFMRCWRDSFWINLISLVAGLVVMYPFSFLADAWTNDSFSHGLVLLGLFYIETIIIEFYTLYWFNKSYPIKKLLPVTLLMNLITYFIIYLILMFQDL